MIEPYYDDGTVRLYLGTWEEVLPQLDEQFDMVFTSPPYNLGTTTGGGFGHYSIDADMNARGGRSLWNNAALADGYDGHDDAMPTPEYEDWQRRFLSAAWDRLSDKGAIFYNHKPRVQAKTLWTPLDVNPGLPVRQIIIWSRGSGMNFAPTHYVPTHEWIVVFGKPDWQLKSRGASGLGDVWHIPPRPDPAHPAPFPIGLPARAIESAAPTSVLDPYCGSGTTLRAAKAAGVRAVGIEKSESYCELAVRRLAQGSLFELEPS